MFHEIFKFFKSFLEIFHTARYCFMMKENKTLFYWRLLTDLLRIPNVWLMLRTIFTALQCWFQKQCTRSLTPSSLYSEHNNRFLLPFTADWTVLINYVIGLYGRSPVTFNADRHSLLDTSIQGWASECPDVTNYKWRLNPVSHRIVVPMWQQLASKG